MGKREDKMSDIQSKTEELETPKRAEGQESKFYKLLLVFVVFLSLGIIWVVGQSEATSPNSSPAIAQSDTLRIETGDRGTIRLSPETIYSSVKIFNDVAIQIKNRYMDDVESRDLILSGIRGMLDDLDPFSVLMERKPYEDLMETTQGRYEGLGMQIDSRDNVITIITPIEGTPAYRMGFRAGDKIIEIDGKSTLNMATEDASRLMRGPAGTTVQLKIQREGVPEYLDFDVQRAVIEIKTVPYAGIMDGGIGYIRLSRFGEDSPREIKQALEDLKGKGAKGIIFDLRSNGGGLLEQSVEIANLFMEKDRLIVYTLGQDMDEKRTYISRDEPIFKEGPLVVLVDDQTASASEIVAGALQDWDRGVVIGDTTYGKGLVQQVFPVSGTSDYFLKLTTARYFTPSGRSIQKPEKSKKHPRPIASLNGSDVPAPAEHPTFKTQNGRVVTGAGGIVPDISMSRETWKPLEFNLERQMMFFDFAVQYTTKHPGLPVDFPVTEQMIEEFRQFVKTKNFTYKTGFEVEMDSLKAQAEREGRKEALAPYFEQMKTALSAEKEKDFTASKEYIRRALKREVLLKLYSQKGYYEQSVFKDDPFVKKALEILTNKAEYEKLLKPAQKKG
ncbi:MAG: S41 family peptidase [candidate division Zixibacteria bacterium]|nr:S41 family peptidase [candidate division Zixibacteria bacterium]